MKNKKSTYQTKMKTRAELINSSRKSVARDYLPPPSASMFDVLKDFKPGVGQFINISKDNKARR
jgi:hypothetical protein